MSYKIYSDGSHFREFDVAGAGGYLLKDDEVVFQFSEQIVEKEYHNIHERFALKTVLTKALEHNIENDYVQLFSDDKALMEILSDVNRRDYISPGNLMEEICDLCDKFKDIHFNYIPRSENSIADKLSREKISENQFAVNQLVEGAFFHPKWISKNNYPRDSTREFNNEKKMIENFLVIHLYPERGEDLMNLDVYYANKKEDVITHEFKGSTVLKLGWQKKCIDSLVNHLTELSAVSESKSIGVVLNDEYILLDQMLRGKKAVPNKCQPSFEKLSEVLESLDKVVVHRDVAIMEAVLKANDKVARYKR